MTEVDELEDLDYVEETGPGIAELPAGPPAAAPITGDEPPPDYPGWDREAIETFLQGTGAGIHMLIGQTERDWLMTKKDLERIAPPMTRIANRWEPALRLSPLADPLLVAHGFALYGWRSALERKRAIRDQEDQLEGPRYERSQNGRASAREDDIEHDDPEHADQEPDVDLEDLDESDASYFT